MFFAVILNSTSLMPFVVKASCLRGEVAQPLALQDFRKSYIPISLNCKTICMRHKKGSIDSLALKARECETCIQQLMQSPESEADLEHVAACFFDLLNCDRLEDAWCLASKYCQESWLEALGKRGGSSASLNILAFRKGVYGINGCSSSYRGLQETRRHSSR